MGTWTSDPYEPSHRYNIMAFKEEAAAEAYRKDLQDTLTKILKLCSKFPKYDSNIEKISLEEFKAKHSNKLEEIEEIIRRFDLLERNGRKGGELYEFDCNVYEKIYDIRVRLVNYTDTVYYIEEVELI